MSTFILIHGAWHGAWCWYKVASALRKGDHRVIVPDLSGLGRDTTPIQHVSLSSWTEDICRMVEAEPSPVILVGHSRGGLLLSTVAERLPTRIARLVYVSAALVQDGQSLVQLLMEDGRSLIIPNIVVADDGLSSTMRQATLREVFYATSPDEDVALAEMLLRPEPTAPGRTQLKLSTERFGSVPRTFVECLQDMAIPIELQRRMCSALPCDQIISIDTDHSPFFSAPAELAKALRFLPEAR